MSGYTNRTKLSAIRVNRYGDYVKLDGYTLNKYFYRDRHVFDEHKDTHPILIGYDPRVAKSIEMAAVRSSNPDDCYMYKLKIWVVLESIKELSNMPGIHDVTDKQYSDLLLLFMLDTKPYCRLCVETRVSKRIKPRNINKLYKKRIK
jgi:hypothetical protein